MIAFKSGVETFFFQRAGTETKPETRRLGIRRGGSKAERGGTEPGSYGGSDVDLFFPHEHPPLVPGRMYAVVTILF